MKLFSAAQIRRIDAESIAALGITSLDLMEQAASACAAWIAKHIPVSAPVVLVCGSGNNGGDGLAIARLLLPLGYSVRAYLLRTAALSADCAANWQWLHQMQPSVAQALTPGESLPPMPPDAWIVDALFGTGLSRPVRGWVGDIIQQMNRHTSRILAIDLPSGLPADDLPLSDGIVRARHTLTFERYKRSMLHEETAEFCGSIHVLPIGLAPEVVAKTETRLRGLELSVARTLYRRRSPFAHKGTLGTAVVIGGSYGLSGAIALAARAAGRAGAGKVMAVIPACAYAALQSATPEAMVSTHGAQHLCDWGAVQGDAFGLGPGMGTDEATAQALASFLKKHDRPVVLDADALNLIAQHPEWLALVPPDSILTPHPGEFRRLFGPVADSLARAHRARDLAMRRNINILVKGRNSFIALSDGACYYNLSGNAGLATGGSGDVLTGILTGLLASRYPPKQALPLGVWMHGAAAEAAMSHQSEESLIATDIAEYLGSVFRQLQEDPS